MSQIFYVGRRHTRCFMIGTLSGIELLYKVEMLIFGKLHSINTYGFDNYTATNPCLSCEHGLTPITRDIHRGISV